MSDNLAMQNDARITVRVPAELDQAIRDLAKELNLTPAEVIRNALTAGVLEGKQVAKRLRNPAFRALIKALLSVQADSEQLDLFERVMAPGAFPDGVPHQ